jgi:itaconate CoA-transferase
MRLPLEGLTVVAIEQAVAAPYCTARLADAGARVLKIERPAGDFARGYDDVILGQSSYFVWLNRGKESVMLDLSEKPALARLRALIDKADVVVQNLKPGAIERLGLDPQDLCARDPALIVCSISGYGRYGPLADRKAFDLLVQAESGLCSITGGAESPGRVGFSVVDIATGSAAHAAILEALLVRDKTGSGAQIDISMFDVIAEWLTVPLLQAESGRPPSRIGLKHPSIAPYGVFVTSDGKDLLLSVQHNRDWTMLCEHLLDDKKLANDARFATNVQRVRNRNLTDALVAQAIAQLSLEEVWAKLVAGGTAFACLNDINALSSHPHLRRITVQTPGGPVRLPAPPAQVRGETRRYGPVPGIGRNEHLRSAIAPCEADEPAV